MTVSKQNISLISDDGVHFTDKGYDELVEYLVGEIEKLI